MRPALVLFFIAGALCAQSPTGIIRGTVKDEVTGDPLPDFTVSVAGPKSFSTRTDDKGAYTFSAVPPGALTLSVENFRRTTVTRKLQLSPADDVTVDLLIPPNTTVSGRVLNQDKEPQARVPVWIVQEQVVNGVERPTLIGPQVTGNDGTYKFDAFVPVGRKFYLFADRSPREELVSDPPKPLEQRELIETPTYFGDAITLDAALPLLLQPAEQRAGLDIKIRKAPYFCADGAVDLAGKPASVLIAAFERPLAVTSLFRLNAVSTDDGAFRLCGLTAGPYLLSTNNAKGMSGEEEFLISDSDIHHLQLTADAASLHLQMVWDGAPPPERPVPASMLPGPDSVTIHYQDGTTRTLSYREFTEFSRVEPGTANRISVHLDGLRNNTRLVQAADVPFDGLYSQEIPAGDYAVDATTRPGCCYVKEMSFGGIRFTDRLLHLAPGTRGTLRIVLSAEGGSLTCKIPEGATAILVSADGQPVPIQPWGTKGWQNLPPGKYRILAVTRPLRLPEESDQLTRLLTQAQDIEIEPKVTKQVTLEAITIE
jgi:hypothetical protein